MIDREHTPRSLGCLPIGICGTFVSGFHPHFEDALEVDPHYLFDKCTQHVVAVLIQTFRAALPPGDESNVTTVCAIRKRWGPDFVIATVDNPEVHRVILYQTSHLRQSGLIR